MLDVAIIGGGAAGFYAAIHLAEMNPKLKIAILEKGKNVLAKVKVSGGGRCNVTHAEFDTRELAKNYPRGEKELLGPFHTHFSGDTVAFFEAHNIKLKIEEDGRMFPVSDSSQTIIDFFLKETDRLGVKVMRHSAVNAIEHITLDNGDKIWEVTSIKNTYRAKNVLMAAGSSPQIWKLLEKLGHTIIPPIPSLFTFNIDDKRISGIPGVSANVKIKVLTKTNNPKLTVQLKSRAAQAKPILISEGPLLVTHWGLSGPAVLRLSAWGAKKLHDYNYRFFIVVNWLPEYHEGGVLDWLLEAKEIEAKKTVLRTKAIDVPRRLWTNLVKASGIPADMKWADVTKEKLLKLSEQLTNCTFQVEGKSTFKEEFVTAGGVDLKEINFKTYESKLFPNLYFAGEVINVDAITGGFNFQNAWTGAYIAAQAIAENTMR